MKAEMRFVLCYSKAFVVGSLCPQKKIILRWSKDIFRWNCAEMLPHGL